MNAQSNRVLFQYDNSGNQIERILCLGCSQSRSSNNSKNNPKDMEKIEDEDLLKFSETDVISYYPNPVRDELYLKWELTDNDIVSNIEVYTYSGQLINSYKNLEKTNNKVISFEDYPESTYIVLLIYKSGNQKSIKILKK